MAAILLLRKLPMYSKETDKTTRLEQRGWRMNTVNWLVKHLKLTNHTYPHFVHGLEHHRRYRAMKASDEQTDVDHRKNSRRVPILGQVEREVRREDRNADFNVHVVECAEEPQCKSDAHENTLTKQSGDMTKA